MQYSLNAEKVLVTQLGDEGVLFDMESNEYVSMNETYYLILQGISEGKSQSEIVENLCDTYDIDTDTCSSSVQNCINEMLTKKYIVAA